MGDPDKRNGTESFPKSEKERDRLEREREALERERERIEKERERVEREREKLERIQEGVEARLERHEERLEQLEEELEERMAALDDAEEELGDLEDLEVEGIDGIREVLDAVSDHVPRLLRGIQESIYSPDQVQSAAGACAKFYKTLADAGMDNQLASVMTQQYFERMQPDMRTRVGRHKPSRQGRRGPGPDFDPLGPNFDPLGPNFDPFGGKPEPSEPAESAESPDSRK